MPPLPTFAEGKMYAPPIITGEGPDLMPDGGSIPHPELAQAGMFGGATGMMLAAAGLAAWFIWGRK